MSLRSLRAAAMPEPEPVIPVNENLTIASAVLKASSIVSGKYETLAVKAGADAVKLTVVDAAGNEVELARSSSATKDGVVTFQAMWKVTGSRGDVLAPLGAYTAGQGLTALDWMRLLVRLPEMIYINFFGDPQRMSAMIDRLSPLFIASYPLAYAAGYLLGPKVNRKQEKQNRRAKKAAVRKAQKSNLVEELTGAQGQVHYGHQKEEHKKKELV